MAAAIYCKIDGVEGELDIGDHEEWIKVNSFEHNVTQPTNMPSEASDLAAGRADFGFFKIEKLLDVTTPKLYLYCSQGKFIDNIVIDICHSAGDNANKSYMKFTLKKALIKSISVAASKEIEPDDSKRETQPRATRPKYARPIEIIHFAYGEIEWEFTPLEDGSIGASTTFGWDVNKNVQA